MKLRMTELSRRGVFKTLVAAQQGAPEIGADGRIERIAVLPFDDFSPGGGKQWVADSIADAILHALSQNRELIVTAKTSSFGFRDSGRTAAEIGKALGVQALLDAVQDALTLAPNERQLECPGRSRAVFWGSERRPAAETTRWTMSRLPARAFTSLALLVLLPLLVGFASPAQDPLADHERVRPRFAHSPVPARPHSQRMAGALFEYLHIG